MPVIDNIKEYISSFAVVDFDERACTVTKDSTGHGYHKPFIAHCFSVIMDEG